MIQVIFVLGLAALVVSVVLYLRAQSLKQFERACQARIDAMRSAAELREIGAKTRRQLRDAALDELRRGGGRR